MSSVLTPFPKPPKSETLAAFSEDGRNVIRAYTEFMRKDLTKPTQTHRKQAKPVENWYARPMSQRSTSSYCINSAFNQTNETDVRSVMPCTFSTKWDYDRSDFLLQQTLNQPDETVTYNPISTFECGGTESHEASIDFISKKKTIFENKFPEFNEDSVIISEANSIHDMETITMHSSKLMDQESDYSDVILSFPLFKDEPSNYFNHIEHRIEIASRKKKFIALFKKD